MTAITHAHTYNSLTRAHTHVRTHAQTHTLSLTHSHAHTRARARVCKHIRIIMITVVPTSPHHRHPIATA